MRRNLILVPPIVILLLGAYALLRPDPRHAGPAPSDVIATSNAPASTIPVSPEGSAAASETQPQSVVRERLYNGILLERPWPPPAPEPGGRSGPLPWPTNLPAALPINVGRQLFVDDFLIESNTLKRAFHTAAYYSNNPVLKPDKPWEMAGDNSAAVAYSGGMAYDDSNKVFRMWYLAGDSKSTCLATSTNGLDWDKPPVDVKKNTNIVLDRRSDSVSVIFDQWETNLDRRFKLFNLEPAGGEFRMNAYFSGDGVRWGTPVVTSSPLGEHSTVFYNPVRRVWVYSIRANSPLGLGRKYYETTNLVSNSVWKESDPVWWVGGDRQAPDGQESQSRRHLFNLEMIPYESMMIGLFTVSRGDPAGDQAFLSDIFVGYSRDGFNWYRPDREPFIAGSKHPGDWNYARLDSVAGGCMIVGRQLYFYVGGRAGGSDGKSSAVASTGLATLRRDGFVSMDAGDPPGILVTRPLVFAGKQFFVNADLKEGELRVQLMDEKNQVIQVTNQTQVVAPDGKSFVESGKATVKLDFANCQPLTAMDYTLVTVNWNGINDLSDLRGKPVKFAFQLRKGSLYSFWISPARNGPSGGFMGAGGPHFNAPVDMIGNKSYNKF